MKYTDFLKSEDMQKAAAAFVAVFGGRFVGEEPGDQLVYCSEDGEHAYTPPEGTASEKVLQVFQKSVQRGKTRNLIPALWPELEYDPGMDY